MSTKVPRCPCCSFRRFAPNMPASWRCVGCGQEGTRPTLEEFWAGVERRPEG